MSDSVVIALISTVGGGGAVSIWYKFYREKGKTLRAELASLRQEVDNLRIQIQPNPTPCIWLDRDEKVINYNGSAVTKVFSRLGLVTSTVIGKHISEVLGITDFALAKKAISSPNQLAKSESFMINGKVKADYAVAYVVYNADKKDSILELQLIV